MRDFTSYRIRGKLKALCLSIVTTLLLVFTAYSQTITPDYTFTNGTGVNSIPLGGGTWADQRNQWLYLPGDFGNNVPNGLAISTIYVRAGAADPASTYTNFEVSLKQDANVTSLSTTWVTGMTQVKNTGTFTAGPVVAN